jgi:stress response protein SCP2
MTVTLRKGANTKLLDAGDVYNAPTGGGAIRLLGKRTDDDGNGEDRISVDLESLPADVTGLAVAASIEGAPGVGFGALAGLELAVVDAAGDDIILYNGTGASTETAFVLGQTSGARSGSAAPLA